jgi:hypothetical protein
MKKHSEIRKQYINSCCRHCWVLDNIIKFSIFIFLKYKNRMDHRVFLRTCSDEELDQVIREMIDMKTSVQQVKEEVAHWKQEAAHWNKEATLWNKEAALWKQECDLIRQEIDLLRREAAYYKSQLDLLRDASRS